MITIQQIKAARALLNWKQSDLSVASGVSVPSIAKIESGEGNPRRTTMVSLQNAFEQAGIDFLDMHGVIQRQEALTVNILHGKNSIAKIWEDIENAYGNGKGGEVLISNLDERIFVKLYRKHMKAMFKRREDLNITTRALVKEDEDLFLMPLKWHRSVPKNLFTPLIYYIYADRLAIADFKQAPRFILIQNQSLADAFRVQFEFNWSLGKPIDPKKAAIWEL